MDKKDKTETIIDTQNKQVVDRGEAGWGMKETGERD